MTTEKLAEIRAKVAMEKPFIAGLAYFEDVPWLLELVDKQAEDLQDPTRDEWRDHARSLGEHIERIQGRVDELQQESDEVSDDLGAAIIRGDTLFDEAERLQGRVDELQLSEAAFNILVQRLKERVWELEASPMILGQTGCTRTYHVVSGVCNCGGHWGVTEDELTNLVTAGYLCRCSHD